MQNSGAYYSCLAVVTWKHAQPSLGIESRSIASHYMKVKLGDQASRLAVEDFTLNENQSKHAAIYSVCVSVKFKFSNICEFKT